MWTKENRIRYNRDKLRYPSDLINAEWSLIEPLIPPAKRGGNKRRVNLRKIVNGIMYVLSTGCQWRAITKDLPPRIQRFGRTTKPLAWSERLTISMSSWVRILPTAL